MNPKSKNELERLALDLDKAARAGSVEADMLGMVHTLTPDEPIRSSKDDQLNRVGFAKELARAILAFDRTESFVIGVYGRWGTGKTSLLNLIAEQLQETSAQAPVIFHFNAWAFSDQEQLIAQFFEELSAFLRLHSTIPPLSGVSETVEEYGKLVSPIARMLLPWTTEAVSTGWSLFKKLKPSRRTVPELKSQINAALRDAAAKLIIILDDIDRLNAIEIRQVFQLIKLNANFSNTVYLVAFDKDPVEKALKKVAPGPPDEYLEKMIQVAFNLPPINDLTLTELLFNKFNEIVVSAGLILDTQRFGNMFHSGFRANFQTLRDINRYFNLLRFAFNVLRNETDFVDLAALQSLALFHPDIYSSIQHNSELFSGGWPDRELWDETAVRRKYDAVFGRVRPQERESVISLCRFLFPKMEYVYGTLKVWYGHESEQPWRKRKRIAASKYFPYYFQFAVPDTEVAQAEFDSAIAAADSVDGFVRKLRKFRESGRFAAFIDLLRDSLDSLSRKQQLVVLGSVFVFGDEVSTQRTEVFGTVSEHVRFGSWLVFDILDRLSEGRFDTLIALMRGQPAVFSIVRITFLFEQVISRDEDAARFKRKYPELTEEIVAEMRDVALEAMTESVREQRLQTAPNLPFLLYRWKEWGDQNAVSEWIQATFLRTPNGAVSFISHFTQPVSSFGLEDKVGRMRITVSLKAIGDFVDLERISQLVHAATDAELTEAEQLAKARFLSAKAGLDAGGNAEGEDFLSERDEDDEGAAYAAGAARNNLVVELLGGRYIVYTYERPEGGSPMVDVFLRLRVHNRGEKPTEIYCDRLSLHIDSSSEAFAMGEFYTSDMGESTKFFRLMAASSEELNLYGRRHDSHPPPALLNEQPGVVRAVIKDTHGAIVKLEGKIEGKRIVNQ